MILHKLVDCGSLEDAAEFAAGNYKDWDCFVWYGEDDVHNNQNVCLGYIVNNVEPTVNQRVWQKVIKTRLAKWWSEDFDPKFIVSDFGSSFHGDKDVLNGLMIRVYDDEGKITEAFQELYNIALEVEENEKLDETIWEEINKELFIDWLKFELPYFTSETNIKTDAETVYALLEERDLADFDDDIWENTQEILEEMAEEQEVCN